MIDPWLTTPAWLRLGGPSARVGSFGDRLVVCSATRCGPAVPALQGSQLLAGVVTGVGRDNLRAELKSTAKWTAGPQPAVSSETTSTGPSGSTLRGGGVSHFLARAREWGHGAGLRMRVHKPRCEAPRPSGCVNFPLGKPTPLFVSGQKKTHG